MARSNFHRRGWIVLSTVVAANVAVWAWAWLAFHGNPALFGMAALACSLGLRHAVDADHIAAIDNVTRHLMQQGKRPVAVGFFFSLGHSSVVILVTLGIALAAHALQSEFENLRKIGSLIGTGVSAASLLIVATINFFVLTDIYARFKSVRGGEGFAEQTLPVSGLRRFLKPLFGLMGKSWHMFFLGFLFGLGFDTATEVSLLGLSAAEVSKGLPVLSIMVFPALFTAAMALIDTLDNLLMIGAYRWAFVNPLRKLRYNMIVTGVSIVVALLIGSVEVAGLAVDRFDLHGHISSIVNAMNDDLDVMGYVIIALFAMIWASSALIYRCGKNDITIIVKS